MVENLPVKERNAGKAGEENAGLMDIGEGYGVVVQDRVA